METGHCFRHCGFWDPFALKVVSHVSSLAAFLQSLKVIFRLLQVAQDFFLKTVISGGLRDRTVVKLVSHCRYDFSTFCEGEDEGHTGNAFEFPIKVLLGGGRPISCRSQGLPC